MFYDFSEMFSLGKTKPVIKKIYTDFKFKTSVIFIYEKNWISSIKFI